MLNIRNPIVGPPDKRSVLRNKQEDEQINKMIEKIIIAASFRGGSLDLDSINRMNVRDFLSMCANNGIGIKISVQGEIDIC
jgi:hypothetical protein